MKLKFYIKLSNGSQGLYVCVFCFVFPKAGKYFLEAIINNSHLKIEIEKK
jgi:hypothetical protein